MSEDKPVPPPQEPSSSSPGATPAKPQFEEGRDPVHVPPKPYRKPPKELPLFDDQVVFQKKPDEPVPTFIDGCLKVIGVLLIGAFVLGGLVFATCFLSMSR